MKLRCAAVILAILLALTGCTAASDPNAESMPVLLQLTGDGAPVYRIIYPYQGGDAIGTMAQQTKDKLKETFGVEFALEFDRLAQDGLADSAVPELLMGRTDRPETENVAGRLDYGGYAVTVEGEKIVVFGNTPAAQQKALDTFFAALSRDQFGEIVLDLPSGGVVEAGEKSFFAEADPSGYAIVYDEDNKAAARTLQTAIRQAYGYELPLRTSGEAETEKEILVGTCGRKAAQKALDDIPSPVGYLIKTDGSRIVLAGKNSFATKQAVEYFRQNYVHNDFALSWQLPNVEYSSSALAGAEYVSLTEGADIRIMSFNILAELWNQKLPVDGRDEIIAATLMTYLPDVIGLQEVTDKWYEHLGPLIAHQYSLVNEKTPEGKTNYSGMAYHSSKVKLIDSGCELFSKGNSGNMRLMNWAVFETISGGERFAVVNTHFDPNSSKSALPNRLVQAKEMGEKVKALQTAYGCPVITTGDYNRARITEEYKLFVETAGVRDAQWDSVQAVNNRYKTTHGVGSRAEPGETAIDHIAYTDGAESLFYINHTDAPAVNASDHNPIMADIRLD